MAKDSANDISWFLRTDAAHKDALSDIRPWANLKVAFEAKEVWVSGFTQSQIHTVEVRSNPFASIFYAKGAKLFPQNSQLPVGNVPSLLWTPIQRAFPIKLPSFNHNYFGIDEKIALNLVHSVEEKEAMAMLIEVKELGNYMETAPEVRTAALSWIVMGKSKALVIGKPVLPIRGDTFWQRGDFLLPAGYDFDLYQLAESLNQRLNPEKEDWILWNTDNSYVKIRKENVKPLSLSSFRLTKDKLTNQQSQK